MHQANFTGNCLRLITHGKSGFLGAKTRRGMKARAPAFDPDTNNTSNTLGKTCTTMASTQLHNPTSASKLRKRMTRTLGANVSSCGGMPDGVSEFKKSTGQSACSSGVLASTSSTLWYVTKVYRGSSPHMSLFTSSTMAFVAVITARSFQKSSNSDGQLGWELCVAATAKSGQCDEQGLRASIVLELGSCQALGWQMGLRLHRQVLFRHQCVTSICATLRLIVHSCL